MLHRKKRGTYSHYDDETQAKIAKYYKITKIYICRNVNNSTNAKYFNR